MTIRLLRDSPLIPFLGLAGVLDAFSSWALFRGGYSWEVNPILAGASPEGVALVRLITLLVSIAILNRSLYYRFPWARVLVIVICVKYALVLVHHALVWAGALL